MAPEFHGFCDIYYIFTILQENLKKAAKKKFGFSQEAIYEKLFRTYLYEKQAEVPAKASLSGYFGGTTPMPDALIEFYETPEHQHCLSQDLQENILKPLPNHAELVQEIFETLDTDDHVVDQKRTQFFKLRSRYFSEDRGYIPPKLDEEGLLNWESHLLADILLFVIQEPIYLRKGKDHIPALREDYHIQEELHFHIVPEPFSPFFGRKKALADLKALFQKQNHIFLTGMAGLGKSELAKTYAAQRKSSHQQTFYIFYTGNLKSDIVHMVNTACKALISVESYSSTSLTLLSQRIDVSPEDQFQRSIAYLRSLGPEDLIVIDNFDALPAGLPGDPAFCSDPLILELLSLQCQLLINTRCSYDQMQLSTCQAYMEVKALDARSLMKLFSYYYPEAKDQHELVEALIEAVFSNTLLVKLTAKLLQDSFLSPEEVLEALKEDLTLSGIQDNITCEIDGALYSQTMSCHLDTMLKLFGITDSQMQILQYMSLMPLSGVSRNTFRIAAGLQNANDLQQLIYKGFLQRSRANRISMHPLLRDVILHKTKPNYVNSYPLLQNLDQICIKHLGEKSPLCTEISAIIDSLVARLESPKCFIRENLQFTRGYLQFIQDAIPFQYFHSQMGSSVNLLDRLDFVCRHTQLFNGMDWFTLMATRFLIGDEDVKRSRKKSEPIVSMMTAVPRMITDCEFLVIVLDAFVLSMKAASKKEWKQEMLNNVISTIGCHSSSKMVRLFCFPLSLYLGQKELAEDLLALPYREDSDCSADDLKADLTRLFTPQEENKSQKSLPDCEENVNV